MRALVLVDGDPAPLVRGPVGEGLATDDGADGAQAEIGQQRDLAQRLPVLVQLSTSAT